MNVVVKDYEMGLVTETSCKWFSVVPKECCKEQFENEDAYKQVGDYLLCLYRENGEILTFSIHKRMEYKVVSYN